MKQYGRYQTQGMISPIKWLFSNHKAVAIYHNRIKATKRVKRSLKPLEIWGWWWKLDG